MLAGCSQFQELAWKGRWDVVTCYAVGLGSAGGPPA